MWWTSPLQTSKRQKASKGKDGMRAIRIRLEYKCYPVWLYDDEGLVEDTALPPELSRDRELDERFGSIQERFDATYVDTPTEFYNKGFATLGEEAAFRSDLSAAVALLAEKCPKEYSLELPTVLGE